MVFFQSCCSLCNVVFKQGLWVFYLGLCRQSVSVLVLCLYNISVMNVACL